MANTVSDTFRCPNCDENDADKLEITETDTGEVQIKCLYCGNTYTR